MKRPKGYLWVGALMLVACNSAFFPPTPSGLQGSWGGAHVLLVLTDKAGMLEFDCAGGKMEGPILPDMEGRFSVGGYYVQEGGPVPIDFPPKRKAARYQGQVTGTQMSLSLTLLDSKETFGPYTLEHGKNRSVYKCL